MAAKAAKEAKDALKVGEEVKEIGSQFSGKVVSVHPGAETIEVEAANGHRHVVSAANLERVSKE